jgi:hypothetical protein
MIFKAGKMHSLGALALGSARCAEDRPWDGLCSFECRRTRGPWGRLTIPRAGCARRVKLGRVSISDVVLVAPERFAGEPALGEPGSWLLTNHRTCRREVRERQVRWPEVCHQERRGGGGRAWWRRSEACGFMVQECAPCRRVSRIHAALQHQFLDASTGGRIAPGLHRLPQGALFSTAGS